ncbi:hypothetical protein D3C80_1188710 [compost metagenome]
MPDNSKVRLIPAAQGHNSAVFTCCKIKPGFVQTLKYACRLVLKCCVKFWLLRFSVRFSHLRHSVKNSSASNSSSSRSMALATTRCGTEAARHQQKRAQNSPTSCPARSSWITRRAKLPIRDQAKNLDGRMSDLAKPCRRWKPASTTSGGLIVKAMR